MDQQVKQLLERELSNLSQDITEPEIVASYINVFTDVDKQRIERECRERSPTHGVHELISRLAKRGPQAFPQFIEALVKNGLHGTVTRLKEKANGLFPMSERAPNRDERSCENAVSRGPVATPTLTSSNRCSEEPINHASITYSQSTSSSTSSADVEHEPCTDKNSNNDNHFNFNNTYAEKKCKSNHGPETLLKDIQLKLKSKIVSTLNVDSALNNDWSGLAGVVGFSVEEGQELRSKGDPMEALFQWMMQQQYTISDLVDKLRKLGREDIISTITKEYGYNCEIPGIEKTDLLAQGENLPSPAQVSESDSKESDDKKDSHKMSQEASDANDDQEDLSATSPSEIPEDDVFLPEAIKGKALFLGVESYHRMSTLRKLNFQVNSLVYTFKHEYDGWEVQSNEEKKCTISMMKDIVKRYLDNVKKNDVCIIYLAGHTLQINGENFLLSTDADINSTAADVMDCSLNINHFLNEITQREPLMFMLFIDGAHYNEVECTINGIVPGLASMIPPSNAVIAYPCKPGSTRQKEQTLSFAESMLSILEVENLSPATLLSMLKQKCPSTCIFSLSPRSILPLYIYRSPEGPEIQSPNSETPRFALIFVNDMSADELKEGIQNDTEHLSASLEQLGWEVQKHAISECPDVRGTLRDSVRHHEGNEMKIVMVYFLGFQSNDQHSLDISQAAPNISLRWVVNLMCEYICGPKVLIVDDPGSNPLDFVTPLPADVLICIPKERKSDNGSTRRESFTLLFAQIMAASRDSKLKATIRSTANGWKHQKVDSNLFFA